MYVCMYVCVRFIVCCVYLCVCAALEHIQRCHSEKESRERQMKALRARVEELNVAIALCQERLPASGAPVTRQVRTLSQ